MALLEIKNLTVEFQTAAGPGDFSSSRTKLSGFTPSQTSTGEEM